MSDTRKVTVGQFTNTMKYLKDYIDRGNANSNIIFYADNYNEMYAMIGSVKINPGAKCFVANESKYYSYYNGKWYDDKCYIISDKPPENTDLIWIDTSNDVKDYNDTISMDALFQTLQVFYEEILDLKARVKYLEEHGGGSGTVIRECLILENGEKFALEDGTELLLESDTGGTIIGPEENNKNAILLEDGQKLLLENGDAFELEIA